MTKTRMVPPRAGPRRQIFFRTPNPCSRKTSWWDGPFYYYFFVYVWNLSSQQRQWNGHLKLCDPCWGGGKTKIISFV
uniref:Uncharacterized protein n=1 Tax=Anguilla anguilla TaxID=7936 RepID=A0A0E9WLR5_ANGAN